MKTQKDNKWRRYVAMCIHSKSKAHSTTHPSATDSEQASGRWYVSCYYPNDHHRTHPQRNNGFNVANNIAHN